MESNLKILRRNGQVVSWQREKIEIAVRKAFLDLEENDDPAAKISQLVEENIFSRGLPLVSIETVQDVILEELERANYGQIAAAYSDYRQKRAQERGQGHRESIDDRSGNFSIQILFEGGQNECWTEKMLLQFLLSFLNENKKLGAIANFSQLFQSIGADLAKQKTATVNYRLVRDILCENLLRNRANDPLMSFFAARIALWFLHRQLQKNASSQDLFDQATLLAGQRTYFLKYIQRATAKGLLAEDLAKFPLERLADQLRPDRSWSWGGLQQLTNDYLLRENGEPIETPEIFWMRVAMGIFRQKQDNIEGLIALYKRLSAGEVGLSPTTLFFSGTTHPHLLPNYIYTLRDSLDDIMVKGIAENALAGKWGATVSGSWSHIRGKGAGIEGTRKESDGLDPFLALHRQQLAVSNISARGGCVFLDMHHWDLEAFLNFRSKTTSGREKALLETALLIPDLFFERLQQEGRWTVFQPADTPLLNTTWGKEYERHYRQYENCVIDGQLPGRRIPATTLWQKILATIFELGYPKIAFRDTINRCNMANADGLIRALGAEGATVMNSSFEENACGPEAEIQLEKHLRSDGSLDWEKLAETIEQSVLMLDQMIDVTQFATEKAQRFSMQYRAIQLGVFGFQNVLRRKNLSYDTDAAQVLLSHISEFLAFHTIQASVNLSRNHGPCDAFASSRWSRGELPWDRSSDKITPFPWEKNEFSRTRWDDLRQQIKNFGIRNAYLNAYSATPALANLWDTSVSILPRENNCRKANSPDRELFWELDPQLTQTLRAQGLWSSDLGEKLEYFDGNPSAITEIPSDLRMVFSVASQLNSDQILQLLAQGQFWLDQAISLPICLHLPSFHQLADLVQKAWRLGLKVIGPIKTSHDWAHQKAMAKFERQ